MSSPFCPVCGSHTVLAFTSDGLMEFCPQCIAAPAEDEEPKPQFTYTLSRYSFWPNAVAIRILQDDMPYMTASLNPTNAIEHHQVAVKDFAENAPMPDLGMPGAVKILQDLGVIGAEPVGSIRAGYVYVPIYDLLVEPPEL